MSEGMSECGDNAFSVRGEHDRRQGRPAVLPWELVGILRVLFLQQYAIDPVFPRHLHVLWETHREVITALAFAPWTIDWWHIRYSRSLYGINRTPAVQAYFDALDALANEYGLDRFMSTKEYIETMGKFYPNTSIPLAGELSFFGYEAIHRWCKRKAQYPRYAAYNFALIPASGGRGEVGEIANRLVYEMSVLLDGEVVTEHFVDHHREPILNLPGKERWYANEELRHVAKERLLAVYGDENTRLIDAELDRVWDAFENAEYVFPDTSPSLTQHIRWLYRRVRYRESCDTIATHPVGHNKEAEDAEWIKESRVRKATDRLKAQIGITPCRPISQAEE